MIDHTEFWDMRVIINCNRHDHWADRRIGQLIFCQKRNRIEHCEYNLDAKWYEEEGTNGGILKSEWTENVPCKLLDILYGVSSDDSKVTR